MENTIDHGNEPARYPSIEVEKKLSRVEGLVKFMIDNPDKREYCDVVLDQVLEAANEARDHFREFLDDTRAERMRMIEQLSCASSR